MDVREWKRNKTTQVKDDYRKSKTWISVTLQAREDHIPHLLPKSLCPTNCTDKGNESATVASQRHILTAQWRPISRQTSHCNASL